MITHALSAMHAEPRTFSSALITAATAVCASMLLLACDAECPSGFERQGKVCRRVAPDAGEADAAVDEGGLPGAGAGGAVGMLTGAANAAGAAGSPKPPTVDPMTQWMCMKNSAGECTSCKQDADCPKRVCEQGFCMDCRDASHCDAANTCLANRCVPERKPSSVWQVSGGGQTSASGLKLQLSIGMPTPVTEAVVGGFKMNAALGAGNF